jgi:3-hydroxyisobutyrate dehydrogenase-like beta-hydroxyacid dehydrogenase
MKLSASASQPKQTKIGVVGLGIIGSRIAAHLRRKGFLVYVWNRSPRPVPNFVGSLRELAELTNYIQIFVSDDNALLETTTQLSEKLSPHHVILAHSTVAPDSMRAAAEIVERPGARFIEATFTGSKGAAEKGELVYYVGGTEEALRKGRPILGASGKEIVHIGAVGQASAIKIATNMVTAATVEAAAEALALIHAQGLPLEKFVEAMRANASYSGTLAMKLPKMLERDFQPHFSVKHMLKDVQIATNIAMSHFLDLRVTAAARDQLVEQTQWGHSDDDYSAVLRKYLYEPTVGFYEAPEPEGQHERIESDAAEPMTRAAEAETQNVAPPPSGIAGSQESVLNLNVAAPAPAAAAVRRGLLKQIFNRFSSGRE